MTRARSGGFTLIEILIALAIIGLMAGVVTVGLDGITKSERLRSAVRSLAGTNDFVRSAAAGAQQTCFLDVDFDQHRYRFRREPPRDAQGRFIDPNEEDRLLSPDEIIDFKESFDWDDLPRDVYFRRLYFNEKQYYDKGPVEVEYSAMGTLNSFILQIQGGKAAEDDVEFYSIVVNGLTGKAEVKEGLVGFPTATEADFSSVMGGDAPGGEGR